MGAYPGLSAEALTRSTRVSSQVCVVSPGGRGEADVQADGTVPGIPSLVEVARKMQGKFFISVFRLDVWEGAWTGSSGPYMNWRFAKDGASPVFLLALGPP